MKPNIEVSIAGIAFLLEPEAYHQLKEYLVRIELGFKENPDGVEILSDIEARIAELILSEQEASQVVIESKVVEIIEQLGLPDGIKPVGEIAYEDGDGELPVDRMTRRLYRNSEGKRIGGVCSGLATYFNVDPVLMRIIFVTPLFLGLIPGLHFVGVTAILYILMWIVLPIAKTPRQKLEMKGGKITAQSIQQTLRSEFTTTNPSPRSERASGVLAELVYVLGRVALLFVKVVAIIIGLALAVSVAVVIAVLIGALFGGFSVAGSIWHNAMMELAPAFSGISLGGLAVLVAFLVLIPLMVVAHLLLSLAFDLPRKGTVVTVMMSIWLLILIYSSVMFFRNLDNIRQIPHRFHRFDNTFALYWDRWEDYDDDCTSRPAINHADTIRVDTIQMGGVSQIDTVKVEYYTK